MLLNCGLLLSVVNGLALFVVVLHAISHRLHLLLLLGLLLHLLLGLLLHLLLLLLLTVATAAAHHRVDGLTGNGTSDAHSGTSSDSATES